MIEIVFRRLFDKDLKFHTLIGLPFIVAEPRQYENRTLWFYEFLHSNAPEFAWCGQRLS